MTETPKPKCKPKPNRSRSAKKGTKARQASRTGSMTLLARFIAGFALAPTLLLAAALGNAWGNTQYVISPSVNDLIEDFGGYALGAAMFCFAFVSIFLMAGRWRWIVPSLFSVAGALVIAGYTLALGVGAGLMCGRDQQFAKSDPDRRYLVVGIKGNCGATEVFTYRVVVREIGAVIPRQTKVFESYGKPIPADVAFITSRVLSVVAKSENGRDGERFTVSLDPETLRPDRVWRFPGGTPTRASP